MVGLIRRLQVSSDPRKAFEVTAAIPTGLAAVSSQSHFAGVIR